MKIGKYNVELVERSEPIDGVWSYWTVEIEHPDGTIQMGEIQSDGHCSEESTLTDDQGNKIET